MSKARKTINVGELKVLVNEFLKTSTCSQDRRQGYIDVLQHMLHSTKNYHGFQYLYQDNVPLGQLPGIIVHGTVENTPHEERFPYGKVDPTRVYFY